MKVVLAGFNIEAEMIERLGTRGREPLTPEVISAAYARVSRDPRSVSALRKEARREVEWARRSNEKIIFGLGHASVAEHAVFNFDLMGISRLAVEEIEHFRLASFTEKSQRYIRLGRDLVIPQVVKEYGFEKEFLRVMKQLCSTYEKLFNKIIATGEEEGVAKEDARYLMPLATSAQLGMTLNARELEYMISKLASHPLHELQILSKKLSRVSVKVTPSLIRYPEPTVYYMSGPSMRREISETVSSKRISSQAAEGVVRLIDATPDGDRRLVASIIFSSGGVTMKDAMRAASRLRPSSVARLLSKTMKQMQPHDSVWREFENIHLLFELTVSASCYAQLKRHRMATIIPQPYDPALGLSVPASVRKAKAVRQFRETVTKAERLYRTLRRHVGQAADYALTNAHRRRVLLGLNMRELYHFSRLRSDRHAQWEIREISDRMCMLASERLPASSILLCGKDRFNEKKSKAFY